MILNHNKTELKQKLQKMVKDGLGSFKIIADFDQTLSKKYVDSKKAHDTFDVFTSSEKVSEDAKDQIKESAENYEKEVPNMSEDEKIKALERNIGGNWEEIAKQNLDKDQINQITKDSRMEFREGIGELIDVTRSNNFSFIVASAGVGDVIREAFETSLKERGYTKEDIEPFKIISNMGEYKNDKLKSFKGETIHPANKEDHITTSESMICKQSQNQETPPRKNILLMGDVIDDLRMVENIENDTCIKLGYFNDSPDDNEEKLEDFK